MNRNVRFYNNLLKRFKPAIRPIRGISLPFVLFVLASCAALVENPLSPQEPPQVQDRALTEQDLKANSEFHAYHIGAQKPLTLDDHNKDSSKSNDVSSIINNRCVVCHGCYDAPCQLKMSSFEGIDRGANKELVYDGTRIRPTNPTRLFEDAVSTKQWREKDFYPVLNEWEQTPEANLKKSLVYQLIALKKEHPLPEETLLPETFELGLDRQQECPTITEFEHHKKANPLWGMPYGLPALSDQEFSSLESWLKTGAKMLPPPELDASIKAKVTEWESFFNGTSLKEKLVSRYMYEHLYLANLYFPETEGSNTSAPQEPLFFKLVRSYTPSGTKIDPIATRRPFDDPGTEQFYYRLRPVFSKTLDKTNMPYRLDEARKSRWNELFYQTKYEVTQLPGYDPIVSANPFDAFEQLPIQARYKFMLDEAMYTISGFIKGPVCRGQIALNVIRDHFWVLFIDPDNPHMHNANEFISEQKDYLRMPAETGSDGLPFTSWIEYSKLQQEYNMARSKRINELFPSNKDLNLDLIWDGDGANQNAALTVYRHFDSATVLKGHHGKVPLTTWLISYTLLERIHYLLVAGFDVHGNLSHQLLTRLYMDFLRMEAEANFLTLLPSDVASQEITRWNQGAVDGVKDYQAFIEQRRTRTTGINYLTQHPKEELHDLVHQKFGPSVINDDPINRPDHQHQYSPLERKLQELAKLRGKHLTFLPEQVIMRVTSNDNQVQIYTLLNNISHTNVAHIFGEASRIVPEEQSLSLLKGIAGSYPNAFWDVKEDELEDLTNQIFNLGAEEDYAKLMSDYGIRRTNKNFWQFSDEIHQWQMAHAPLEGGLLDYNRLENR